MLKGLIFRDSTNIDYGLLDIDYSEQSPAVCLKFKYRTILVCFIPLTWLHLRTELSIIYEHILKTRHTLNNKLELKQG